MMNKKEQEDFVQHIGVDLRSSAVAEIFLDSIQESAWVRN
jgi:hypothetical protein